MKILLHSISALCIAMAATACSDSHNDPGGQVTEGNDSQNRLCITVNDGDYDGSRSSQPAGEPLITDVLVMLFTETAENSNIPATLWRVLEARNLSPEDDTPGHHTFDITYGIDPSTAPKRLVVVALANAASQKPLVEPGVDARWNYSDVQQALSTNYDTRTEGTDGFRFTLWGIAQKSIETGVRVQTARISLVRDMSRAQVNLTGDAAGEQGFRLAYALVYNRQNDIYLMPAFASLDETRHNVVAPTVSASPSVTECESYTAMPWSDDSKGWTLYTPEQNILMGGNGDPSDDNQFNRPALIIGGYYRGNHSKVYWYRVDFLDGDGKLLDLLRNHSYNINVKAVNGPGEDTPGEAYRSLTTHVNAEIVEWTDMSMEASFDGSNWIAVPRRVVVDPQAGSETQVQLYTNVDPGYWEAAWAQEGTEYESLEFSPSTGECVSADGNFSVAFPEEFSADDGSAILTVKAVTALPDNVESRSMQLYINVTPKLRLVLPVIQTRATSDKEHGKWGEANVFDEI